jgi:molybdate transport system regulatory protein
MPYHVLAVRASLWVERDDLVVLSRWRVDLLQAIDETGSISAAARRMDVEHHRLSEKLAEMEQGFGVQLVERQAGGPGGGDRLTPAAHDYVARFNAFVQSTEEDIRLRFRQFFPAPTLDAGDPDPEDS